MSAGKENSILKAMFSDLLLKSYLVGRAEHAVFEDCADKNKAPRGESREFVTQKAGGGLDK